MYRTAIVGARYDNVDIDTIIGFNTTLNELSGKEESPKLAEIDAQTADLVLEDINKLLHRIEYIEQIHNLNTGNKYNVQNKTALNKQFILFNRFNQFISTV
jgi:flagellar biosynthesis/type III secretory pathway chaperone